MNIGDESELDGLFERYRAACPDVEPSALFTPVLWEKIEARRGFWSVFQGFARAAMTACAALMLVLLALNLAEQAPLSPSYADALVADHGVESTDYADNVTPSPAPVVSPQESSGRSH